MMGPRSAESDETGDASALFGAVAADHARYRLTYPEAFFPGFVERLPGGAAATVGDCGCGNGQASPALAACVRDRRGVHPGGAAGVPPRGAMAWIGYLPPRLEGQALQERLDRFLFMSLEAWWPPERRWVDDSYRGLPFPGEEWPFPEGLWGRVTEG